MMEATKGMEEVKVSEVQSPLSAEDMAFWKKEMARTKALVADVQTATVSDPKTQTKFGRAWTHYGVTSSISATDVRRRYSDFEWLRELLGNRFDGCYIPPLPGKKVLNQGDEFIKQRMNGLTSFLNEVLRNPYMRCDNGLYEFLTQTTQSAWDSFKKQAINKGADSEGANQWVAALLHLPVPGDIHATTTSLVQLVSATEKEMTNALNAAKKFMEKSTAYAAALEEFKESLVGLESCVETNGNGLPDTSSDVRAESRIFASTLSKTVTALTQWHDLASFQPNELQLFLIDYLTEEIARLRAQREIFARRDQAFTAYQYSFQAHNRKQNERARLLAAGKQDKATKMDPQIEAVEKALKDAELKMNNSMRGIIYMEMGRRAQDRDRSFAMAVGQFASLGIASGLRLQQLWKDVLADIGLDQQRMLELTQGKLAGEDEPYVETTYHKYSVSRAADAGFFGVSAADLKASNDGAAAAATGGGAGGGAGADAAATATTPVAAVVEPAAAAVDVTAAAAPADLNPFGTADDVAAEAEVDDVDLDL